MKPAAFDYVRADSLDSAIARLTAGGALAKVIAGGQSLVPLLNLRLVQPTLLVDIRGCASLRSVHEEADAIVLGAGITHAAIEDGRVPDIGDGWLANAARRIAYRAVRNRGTLGGSLAHADPAADWLCVLLALDAEVVVAGAAGERRERLEQFVTGAFQTSLRAGEILSAVRVPKPTPRARLGRCKLSIKTGEFAKAMAVVLDDPGRSTIRAVLGAIEQTPLVFSDASGLLEGPCSAEALITPCLPRMSRVSLRLHAVALSRALRALGDR